MWWFGCSHACRALPPAEIHVVDERLDPERLSGAAGLVHPSGRDRPSIYATWQRTSNEGKRRPQVHGFRRSATPSCS